MKQLIATLVLLAGPAGIAQAHTRTLDEGIRALYHQLLGAHHLPLTILLIATCVLLLRRWWSRA